MRNQYYGVALPGFGHIGSLPVRAAYRSLEATLRFKGLKHGPIQRRFRQHCHLGLVDITVVHLLEMGAGKRTKWQIIFLVEV